MCRYRRVFSDNGIPFCIRRLGMARSPTGHSWRWSVVHYSGSTRTEFLAFHFRLTGWVGGSSIKHLASGWVGELKTQCSKLVMAGGRQIRIPKSGMGGAVGNSEFRIQNSEFNREGPPRRGQLTNIGNPGPSFVSDRKGCGDRPPPADSVRSVRAPCRESGIGSTR
jgi:hypothetical protein